MRPLLFAFKKVAFAAYLMLLLTALFLLLASPDRVAQIGLGFDRYFDRKVLEIALLGCAAAQAAYMAWIIGSFTSTTIHQRRLRKTLTKTLLNLSGEEKQLVREFIRDGKTSIYASQLDQAAKELHDKAIIYRTSLLLSPGRHFQYSLQPAIREFLEEHPVLLASAPIPFFDKEQKRRRNSVAAGVVLAGQQ